MTPSPFSLVDEAAAYAAAVDAFLAAPDGAAVPVLTDGRADLAASVDSASSLYAQVRCPAPRTYGIMLKAEELPAGLVTLMAPFASTWLDEGEISSGLLDKLFEETPDADRARAATDDAGQRTVHSLVIAGLYEHLVVDLIWPLVRAAVARPDVRLTFLAGRDRASLAWFTAKQYAGTAPDVRELGLYTAVDRGITESGVRVVDERGVKSTDVKADILDTRWRRLMLQGHGKDDSLNLGEFTVCGLNEAVPRNPALVGPMCAYKPTCYKPVDKLIPLRKIRTAEIVMSSCNNGPFADAAVYDPKFQLMLNALDGTAKNVVSAITVNDAGRAENRAWLEAVLVNGSSASAINASICGTEPFPAYLHFGLGDDAGTTPATPAVVAEPLLLTASCRLTAYLAGGLLSPGNPLRSRLGKLAVKIENQVAKRELAARDRAETTRSLLDDLQSLDLAIAKQFVKEPDNDLSNSFAYFGDRSRPDSSSYTHVRCQCGRPAERYTRRALVPTALDTECVICTRCGDVASRLPEAPALSIYTDEDLPQGGTLPVRVVARDARPGIIRIGLFVASYGRAECTVTPGLRTVRIGRDGGGEAEFTLTAAPDMSGQAYHMTTFAVQDLAVSLARRHFGVNPVSGSHRAVLLPE
jgi:hypothetical protein